MTGLDDLTLGKGLVVILRGYFDESMRSEGREPLCVGGFLFRAVDYKRFRRRWSREVLSLQGRRFNHFHMTDLYAGHGEYSGLSLPERISILDRAVEVIGATLYASFGVHFDQAEFEAVAPAEWPKYRGSIYSAAVQMCVQSTAFWIKVWGSPLEVLYVFEQGHKFQAEADDVLTAIKRNERARKYFRYRKHLFETKDREVGLQAADLWTWTITKAMLAGGTTPKGMRPFVDSVIRLAQYEKGRQKIHSLTGQKLRQFLKEQANPAPDDDIPVEFRPRRTTFR